MRNIRSTLLSVEDKSKRCFRFSSIISSINRRAADETDVLRGKESKSKKKRW
ncbi:MAG: hypothetical protein WBJ82_01210 [Tepidanaerobacteraceae bacterium]|nr:hypothetical protein [Tepidanaerobacter sp.]